MPGRAIPAHSSTDGPRLRSKKHRSCHGEGTGAHFQRALLASCPTVNTVAPALGSGSKFQKGVAVADREPIFNVPSGVLAVLGVLIAVHVLLAMMPPEDFNWWVLALAFIPARYSGFASQLPGGDTAAVTSFVTHMAVHADVVHLGFNSVWLLAFGSVLCARIGSLRFIAFSLAGGIAGVLLFLLINPGLMAPVIGASGAVSAMMGAVMRFLFPAMDRHEGYLLRHNPRAIPSMTLAGALTDRRVVLFSIVFIAINLLAIIGFGKFGVEGSIAWEAHVGGYIFGLCAFAAFDIATHKNDPPSPELD